MEEKLPTGLPRERDPLDPTPNVDVLDPDIPQGESDADDTESILAPGFGNAQPEPSY